MAWVSRTELGIIMCVLSMQLPEADSPLFSVFLLLVPISSDTYNSSHHLPHYFKRWDLPPQVRIPPSSLRGRVKPWRDRVGLQLETPPTKLSANPPWKGSSPTQPSLDFSSSDLVQPEDQGCSRENTGLGTGSFGVEPSALTTPKPAVWYGASVLTSLSAELSSEK